jgi:hypothetical protein
VKNRTRRAAKVVVCALAFGPVATSAQTLDGTAEWTVAKNASTSNSQDNINNAFWQHYALGYTGALWDPRLIKLNSEISFRTDSLTARGTEQANQQGRQNDLGFKLGTSIFPSSAFPVFVQASRLRTDSSGDLGPSNPIRSGIVDPTGALPPDFQTEMRMFSVGGQLTLENLPHVDLAYRSNDSVVTGGSFAAQQSDADLSAGVSKETTRTRQSFRYQHTAFDSLFSQAFGQRLDTLDYDFGAALSDHTHIMLHTGRRGTFARSELSAQIVDPATGPYTPPPSQGKSNNGAIIGTISYEPASRLWFRLGGSFDQQTASDATTKNRIGTAMAHYEVVRGLSLNATGTAGDRGQIVGNVPITVATESALAGITYQAGVRWLDGSVTVTRGVGSNATPEGRTGATDSWSREANLTSTFRWLSLGTGYERVRSRDGILDYGNYDSERVRASVQAQARRLSITTSADQVRVERGQALTFATNRQQTYTGSASYRLLGTSSIMANAGGFSNAYSNAVGTGLDRTLFWSLGGHVPITSTLRGTVSVRREDVRATSTHLSQQGLSSFGQLEYRLRTITLSVEYRNNKSLMQFAEMPNPDRFRGRQLRFSIMRKFGLTM